MRRVLMATVACCALVACSQERTTTAEAEGPAPATSTQAAPAGDAAAPSAAAPAAQADARAAPPSLEIAPAEVPEPPQLAYSYRFALETPEERVAGLMRRHERACVVAGPQICQLTGAESAVDEDSGKTSGELTLRAVPAWVEDFRDRLEADAAEADGRMLQTAAATDDVTRALGDHEANVVRLTNERERLNRELRAFRGPLQARLDIERELEEVEAQLGGASRDLRGEQARVTMSTVQVRYTAAEAAVARGAFAPLASAGRDFTGIVVAVLAVLVRVGAVLLIPGLIVGGIWGAIRWNKRRRAASPAQAA